MRLNLTCGRRALAANAVPRPPQQQQLRPGGGPPTKSLFVPPHSDAPEPYLWEARPRGEPSPAATSTAKTSPRGRASHKERCSYLPTAICLNPACGRRALAANAAPRPPQKQKLRPGGGPPTKKPVRTSPTAMHLNPACGRRALAANSAPRPPQQQTLRPGGGPPTKSVFVPHPQPCTSTLPVGGAPSRRTRSRDHLNSNSFAPGRASHKERVRTSPTAMRLHPACGRRALAANPAPWPPQQQELRPGGGPPTKSVFVPHPQPCT